MASLNHTRVKVFQNPNYAKSGIKSYVWLLQKYGIKPTKEGPYFRGAHVHHQGKYGAGGLHDLHGNHQHHKRGHQQGQEQGPAEPSTTSSGTAQPESSESQPPVGGRTTISQSILQKRIDAKGTVGPVTTEDQQNDSLYLSQVTIGNPPQQMMLDFDTGSSDLWVWSTKLDNATQNSGRSSGHHIFDPTKSKTWKDMTGSTWKISYGDGSSASGTVGTDLLQLGGITVENQAIELASTLAQAFVQGTGDGLLGLAMGSINTVKPQRVQTPVENMISQQDIPKSAELFTAYLGSWRDADEADKGESFYTFGYIDQPTLKAAGVTEPYYTPLKTPGQGFWEFDSAAAEVNGQTIQRSGNTAIADTGTTLALVEDSLVEAIYKSIPGSKYDSKNQGYVFPTDTKEADLPTVGFSVGSKTFYVQKEDLLFSETTPGWCYGGIQSRGSLTFDILGDTFLKGIYAIFDQGNNQFGAVQRIETTQNLAPPQPEQGQ